MDTIEVIRLIANGSAALAVIIVVGLFLKFIRETQRQVNDLLSDHVVSCQEALNRNTEAVVRGSEAVSRFADAMSRFGMMFEMCRGSGQKMPESSGHAKDKEGP